jgi:hypothetical protein
MNLGLSPFGLSSNSPTNSVKLQISGEVVPEMLKIDAFATASGVSP